MDSMIPSASAMTSYQVLARKWRPKSFETLIGQPHVVRAISHALEQNRLHHAYLFTGTRGVGKTTIARILAKSLNCQTGITAKPCGECSTCLDIDRGRFVDLLEVDAASNTQVDSMRELLENAQYAPTVGRFKVYIIDEVHMLSKSAFNAMLKTLEEPPAHVKFILATTDPQKVPITVLSRCLQFNLRQMPISAIVSHLGHILTEEQIPFEPSALQMIARAANGSMRDALSLLDQAIAYGSSQVKEAEVSAMLGAIDHRFLFEILEAILRQDGQSMMQTAANLAERSISFESTLADLASLLQQIAVLQAVPETLANDIPDRDRVLRLTQTMSAEQVQLFYQITLLGRRDLSLAPDEQAGFNMTLLRMLAFVPQDTSTSISSTASALSKASQTPTVSPTVNLSTVQSRTIEKIAMPATETTESVAPPVASSANKILSETTTNLIDNAEALDSQVARLSSSDSNSFPLSVNSPSATVIFDGDWRGLIERLKLGIAKSLALNCELLRYDADNIHLRLPSAHKHLIEPTYRQKLSDAIQQYFNYPIKLHVELGETDNTPATQMHNERVEQQSQAEIAIREDPFIKALIQDFGAQIVPASIRPLQ